MASMMTVLVKDLGLRPAQLKAVEKKAKVSGTTAPAYIRLLVERDLLADKSFSEILGPIRQDFHAAGITHGQLDDIVRRARKRPARSAVGNCHAHSPACRLRLQHHLAGNRI